jgi:beta-phosphoglucomutase-like phosphatase (HAD superfamily)/dTDP-glucose pyrophosphorylase
LKNRNLVIFDLDGVLIDSKELHFIALNEALENFDKEFVITKKEHLSTFDGLPTKSKLNKLTSLKGLPRNLHEKIWKIKQTKTLEILQSHIDADIDLFNYITQLKSLGYIISVASNSIKESVKIILTKLGIIQLIDFYLCNEDVSQPKPHPEIFWKCMTNARTIPRNTVIIEDSNFGRQAAIYSGAHLIPVDSRKDINQDLIDRVQNVLGDETVNSPWRSDKLNVLIPMAGGGTRFQTQGYTFPKPLIDVRGKPMIQVVVDNLNIDAHFIFIVQKEHYEKYNLNYLLPLIAPNCDIVQVDIMTEGAACTTLLAKEFINNNNPLLMANSDQFIEWNSGETLYALSNENIDGAIITFEATHPKWSYAKVGTDGFVSEVAEKKPISKNATAGIYFWKKGSDYVRYAEQMIKKNFRVNNEFYVCPVFNEAIQDKKKFRIFEIEKHGMWGIGTPEDLNFFLENYKGKI